MDMRVPVETTTVSVDGAENTNIQRPFTGGVQQVIDRQTAEVVEQPAVDLKQGPERIGKSEDQVYPVAVRQAVKLSGNPQVGGLFAAGGAGAAVAGIGDVFYMRTAALSQPNSFTPAMRVPQASILVTASTSMSRRPPASRKDVQHWLAVKSFLSGRGVKPDSMKQIKQQSSADGKAQQCHHGAPGWIWRQ